MKPADKYQRELFSGYSKESKMNSGSTENRLARESTGNSDAAGGMERLISSELISSELNSSESFRFENEHRLNFEVPKASPELLAEDHPLRDVSTQGYLLLDLPLEGAMGAVYRAWNIKLERVVALKLSTIDVETSNRAAKEKQLVSEAANLARIEHPSIATCYGYGKFGDISYFEMQWVEGVSFDQLIKFLFEGNFQNALETNCLKDWMLSLVEALIYCQHRGIHHLDLKPRNLILAPKRDARPAANKYVSRAIKSLDFESVSEYEIRTWCRNQEIKVLDFGVACRSQEDGVIATRSGTPAWMSPEQVCGSPVKPIHIDQYGIGGVFYACLTGRSPNDADIEAFKSARRDSEPERFCHRPKPSELNRKVDDDLEAIVLKCLSSKPELRYSTFDKLRNDITASRSLKPISARSLGAAESTSRYVRRHPWAVGAIAVLLAGLSVMSLLVVSLFRANKDAVAARQSDKATFEQAVNSVATMDRLVMGDPKMNKVENRDLSTRFKATLFELYRLLSERQGLEVEERRRLASISQRLAVEQQKRGDYQLAASFHKTTAEQYRSVMEDDNATKEDVVAWCLASVDQLKAESLVNRKIHSTESILDRASALANDDRIVETRVLALYTLSNRCRLRFELEGRDGARRSKDLLDQAVALADSVQAKEAWQKLLKARSLYNIGRVRYKGAITGFAQSYEQSLGLYRELLVDSPSEKDIEVEYASVLNTVTMAAVSYLSQLFATTPDADNVVEHQRLLHDLVEKIDRDYSTAADLINAQRAKDPLNNELLQNLISSQWMVADFYRFRSEIDPAFSFANELEMRAQCMASINLMRKRQPLAAKANHDLALHLFRQSCCYRNLNRDAESVDCIKRIVDIEDWWHLKSFEVSDTVRFVFRILEHTAIVGGDKLVDSSRFKVVLKNAIGLLERYHKVAGKPLEIEPNKLSDLGNQSAIASYSGCEAEITEFLRLTRMQIVDEQDSVVANKPLNQHATIVDVPLGQ